MSTVDEVVAALRKGRLVIIPTDTVYGLACGPFRPEPLRTMSLLKGRQSGQPVSLAATSVDVLLQNFPEFPESAIRAMRALLPGPYTLVLPNPRERFPWLSGNRPDSIGVRVPELTGDAADVVAQLGLIAATSANLHGDPDPRRLDDIPGLILGACAAALDGGELPGTPSTVVDLTGPEPRVLREGAVPAAEALARIPK